MRSVTLQDSGGLSFYIASYNLLATYTFHATAIAIVIGDCTAWHFAWLTVYTLVECKTLWGRAHNYASTFVCVARCAHTCIQCLAFNFWCLYIIDLIAVLAFSLCQTAGALPPCWHSDWLMHPLAYHLCTTEWRIKINLIVCCIIMLKLNNFIH